MLLHLIIMVVVAIRCRSAPFADRPEWSTVSPSTLYDNCEQLAPDSIIWWSVDATASTIWFALESSSLDAKSFIAFGLSGDAKAVRMTGADVVVASFLDGTAQVRDYFLQDMTKCMPGHKSGVCPDTVFPDGVDNVGKVFGVQYALGNGSIPTSLIHYSRSAAGGPGRTDRRYDIGPNAPPQVVIWAIGQHDQNGLPVGHDQVARDPIAIQFGRTPQHNCRSRLDGRTDLAAAITNVPKADDVAPAASTIGHKRADKPAATTTAGPSVAAGDSVTADLIITAAVPITTKSKGWPMYQVRDPLLVFTIGPSRTPDMSGAAHTDVCFYVNEKPAPELVLVRGVNYTFEVMTGSNRADAHYFHPMYITDDPMGGAPARAPYTIVAGPVIGRLCLWTSSLKRNEVSSDFGTFFKSLTLGCDKSPFGYFTWMPTSSTPDIMYYHSSAKHGLGSRIKVIDAPLQTT